MFLRSGVFVISEDLDGSPVPRPPSPLSSASGLGSAKNLIQLRECQKRERSPHPESNRDLSFTKAVLCLRAVRALGSDPGIRTRIASVNSGVHDRCAKSECESAPFDAPPSYFFFERELSEIGPHVAAWLRHKDSNLDNRVQSPGYYRCTMPQCCSVGRQGVEPCSHRVRAERISEHARDRWAHSDSNRDFIG